MIEVDGAPWGPCILSAINTSSSLAKNLLQHVELAGAHLAAFRRGPGPRGLDLIICSDEGHAEEVRAAAAFGPGSARAKRRGRRRVKGRKGCVAKKRGSAAKAKPNARAGGPHPPLLGRYTENSFTFKVRRTVCAWGW
jgi:hypothetical protein